MATASIYVLIDPFTKEVRYVGKANDPSLRLRGHFRDSRRHSRPVCRWVASLLDKGAEPVMEILVDGVEDWQSTEIAAIRKYREAGARLLNVANGGHHVPPSRSPNNGRIAARARNAVFWRLLRDLGGNLRWLKDNNGHPSIISKVEAAQAYLRSIPRERQEAYVAKYEAARSARSEAESRHGNKS
jgi:hypothetical protein